MIRTNIYLPIATHQKLQNLSKQEKKSMAEMIRKFVDKGIAEQAKKETGADVLLKMAERAKKSKGSGLKDLAINHDYYLYGEGRID